MSAPLQRSLDYATPPKPQSSPVNGLNLPLSFLILMIAGFFSITVWRINPGGPFISIHADVLPVAVSLTMLTLAVGSMRRSSIARRIGLGLIILACMGIIYFVATSVISFWLNPYGRGALFGL